MVVDEEFRRRVHERGECALEGELTAIERERLVALARDRGLDATRFVHKDFRLSKLYVMLPLTRFMLGRELMLREVGLFWSENFPVTHYFLPEALDFCKHLQARLLRGQLRVKYLEEIVAYERAELELKRACPQGDADALPPPQLVRFRYDPSIILSSLARRRRPRAVPRHDCTLVATLDAEGNINWNMREEVGGRRPEVSERQKAKTKAKTRAETKAKRKVKAKVKTKASVLLTSDL
jgi:hypothetical protein